MPSSTVLVYYGDGSPARHTRVVLGFSGGMTQPGYTDDRGAAQIDHVGTGTATVYVDGSARGTFHAPGRTTVTL